MASGMGLVPVAVAITPAAATAGPVLAAGGLVDVGQEGQLAGALHGAGDLALVPATRAGDPPGADLALLGDEPTQAVDVLVVDVLDLVLAIRTGLAPSAGRPTLPITAPH